MKISHHLLPQINTHLYLNQVKTGCITPFNSNTYAQMQATIIQNIYYGPNTIQPNQYIQSLYKNYDLLEILTNRILKTSK